ncbi:SMC-Scp complex subunit ScpB [Propylenella binzhouense]|uniref:SMC-Scp complex subunit ScpB n=1 Tax=Propylenella binzhouense TaxID=2555902 RepID=A0A964WSV7_9HYPH|nr:SMC-Scp complex subunit ScpB [Propylenella binzhouense]MYZ47373.1 SMC-Scp complex subunit ScpB [Propylenella binzhouense]
MPEGSAGRVGGNIRSLSSETKRLHLRILEALLFASAEPVPERELARHLPADADLPALLAELQAAYAGRGVNLRRIEDRWAFRTADDLAHLLQHHVVEERKLSRAALETLAIIAYHQPVTRAEIEEIRGVSTSSGTVDVLLETGWVRLRGRRRSPGRPVTLGTTPAFLDHFGLETIGDLPGLAELRAAGLLEGILPPGLAAPTPDDSATLAEDEDPLDLGADDGGEAHPR